MDKKGILETLISEIETEQKQLEQNLESIQRTVNEAPAPSESHSDTTRYQMSKVESEVAKALAEKQTCVRALASLRISANAQTSETIGIGSLLEVEDKDGNRDIYFILPEGGGMTVTDGHKEITVLTAKAPLAQCLLGNRKGETVQFKIATVIRELRVIDVC